MKQHTLINILLTFLSVLFGCNIKTTDKSAQIQTNSQEMTVTVETLKQIPEAFNKHDLGAIMEFCL